MAYKREHRGEQQVVAAEPEMEQLGEYVAGLSDSASAREREAALKSILTLARRGNLARRTVGQSHESVIADAIMQLLCEPRKGAPLSETITVARIAAAMILTGDVEDDGDFAVAATEAVARHFTTIIAAVAPTESDVEDDDEEDTTAVSGSAVDDAVLFVDALTVLHAFSHDNAVEAPQTKAPLAEWLLANINFEATALRVAIAVAKYVALWLEPATAPVDTLVSLTNDLLRPRACGGKQKDVVALVGLLEVIHDRFGSDASASVDEITLADITGPTKAARAALTRYERLLQTQELPPITIAFDTDVKVFTRQATATTALTSAFSQAVLVSIQAVLGNDGIDANHLYPVYHYFLGELNHLDFHSRPHKYEDGEEVQRAKAHKNTNRSRNKDRDDKSSRQDYTD